MMKGAMASVQSYLQLQALDLKGCHASVLMILTDTYVRYVNVLCVQMYEHWLLVVQ